MMNINRAIQLTAALKPQHLKLETRHCKQRTRLLPVALCLLAGAFALSPANSQTTNGTWNADASGNWSDTTKWSGGIVADGLNSTANFNMNITANRTVTNDSAHTVGYIIFGDTSGNSLWTLRNGATVYPLILDNTTNAFVQFRAVQNSLTVSVPLAGTNAVRMPDTAHPGTVLLNASNYFTGDLQVSRYRVRLGVANAIPTGPGYGNVVLLAEHGNAGTDTGILDLNTFSPTINGLSSIWNSGSYPVPHVSSSASSGSALTLTVGNGDANGEFGGLIKNGTNRVMNLTKIGNGTQSLTNANTYSGDTVINGGTLMFANGGSCASSPVTLNAAGTLKIQLPAADATWTAKSLTFSAGTLIIDLNGNPISTSVAPLALSQGVTFSATPTVTITGPTIGNGTYPLIKYTTTITGAGLMPVTANLPGGGTGTLQDNPATQTIELVVGGGVFPPNIHWATGNGTWDTSTYNWKTIPGVSTNYVEGVPVQFKDADATGNPTVTLNGSVQPASVLINASKNYTLTGSGSIDGGAGLSKSGTGTLTLDLASGFTGGAAVSQGTVNIRKTAAFGSASSTLTLLGGTLDNTSGGPLTLLDYPQAWNGDFTFAGSSDLDMGLGNLTLNAPRIVTVNASTLRVGGSISYGSQYAFAKAGAGTLRMDGSIGTMIGNVTVNAGTLVLGAANTFVGDTRIAAGNLIVADSLALQKCALNLDPADAGTWSFSNLTSVTLGSLKGSRALSLTNASGAAVELRVGNWNRYASGVYYNGVMSGLGSLTKVGNGDWQLGGGGGLGSGTYSGDTTVVDGTLRMGANNVFPYGTGKGNMIINNPGMVDIYDRAFISVNGLYGDGVLDKTDPGGAPNAVLTVGNGDASGDFSGAIKNTGVPASSKYSGVALVKTGTGTQILSGENLYTNYTRVDGGTLLINSPGSLAAESVVTVNSSATLGGSGTINGPVTVHAGGSIAAGASAGTLTLANGLDLSAGGTNVWELAALKDDSDGTAGTDFDQIALTGGALTLGGSSTLSLKFIDAASAPDSSNPFWQSTRKWTIISVSGAASNFGVIANGVYAAGTFTTAVEATGIVLTFTPGGVGPTPVANFSITAGPGSDLTLNYSGGSGSQFVLLQTNNVAAPLANWTRIKTNVSSPGSFTITPGSNPQDYYRVKSE
jgi:fibronectin-binding autotransporter adhesin